MTKLKAQITEDMKNAMRAKDTLKLSTIRMLLAAIKTAEIDNKHSELDDSAIISIIDKLGKQRKDSAASFEQAQRPELAAQELAELQILQAYLPARLSSEAMQLAVQQIISEVGASSAKDMGKVMAAAKAKLAGTVDMGELSKLIKQQLSA